MFSLNFLTTDIFPYLVAYFCGMLTAASGKYIADKYTDKRRQNETQSALLNEYKEVASKMPYFIKDLKKYYEHHRDALNYNFQVSESKRKLKDDTNSTMIFLEEDYDRLQDKINLLVEYNFVSKVADMNLNTTYQFKKDFILLVKKTKINKKNKISIRL